VNIIKVVTSLITFYVFFSDISLVATKSIINFSNFYNLQEIDTNYKVNNLDLIKSELNLYNCSEKFDNFKVYVGEVYKDNNYNVSDKYRRVLVSLTNQKSCVHLSHYYEFDSLLQLILANYFKNTKCYKELEKAAQGKDSEFRQKLLEKVDNLSKKNLGYYINLMYTINNFNNCGNN
jgi:hypothetical protein